MYVSVCLGAQSSQFVSINQAKQEKSENLFREKGKFNNLPKNRDPPPPSKKNNQPNKQKTTQNKNEVMNVLACRDINPPGLL